MKIFLVRRILHMGVNSIWRNRLRSFLTVLGIVFGVCSVIAMLAIGEGAAHDALEQIRELGSQNIIVRSVKPTDTENIAAETTMMLEYGLTYNDAERIRSTVPSVEVIAPQRAIRGSLQFGHKRTEGNVIGVVPWFPEVAHKNVQPGGRFITDREMRDRLNVCVISDELAKQLFLFHQPLGQDLKVKDDYYRIIGVMEPEQSAQHSKSARSAQLNVYIPLTAARFRIGDILVERQSGAQSMEKVELHQLTIKVHDASAVERSAKIIDGLLKRFHKKQDYEIIVPLELLQKARRTQRIFSIVLGSIAAISLLVGGIGIMNIMLATVTERTREIGIRRALGAKKRDIILQFLMETTLLAGFGGALGVLIGVSIPFFIEHFAAMTTIIRWWSPVGAFAISLVIGIVFGLYPAWRAAQMNPISALRHE